MSNLAQIRIVLNNSGWMAFSRLLMAFIKFITVPLLLAAYGKANFGVMALALALNAYLQILAMGIPTGMVKHVASWLAGNDHETLRHATRTNMSVYIGLGLFNALILIVIGFQLLSLFKLTPEEAALLQRLIFISAVVSVASWPHAAIGQLLQGAQEIAFLSRIQALQCLLEAAWVGVAVWSGAISIEWFFAGLGLINLVFVGNLLRRWQQYAPLRETILPGWCWRAYRPIVIYSAGLFLLSLAQISFIQFRPIIMAMRSVTGSEAVADYRILYGISQFFELTAMWIVSPLIPAVSHALAQKNHTFIEQVLIDGSRYAWLAVALPLFGVVLSAEPLLTAYVGSAYAPLAPWLGAWLIFVGLGIFRAPVAASLLASGKLRVLIGGTWVAALASIAVCWLYTPRYGIGGAVIASAVYTILQFGISTFYLLPRHFGISPWRYLGKCFCPGFITGSATAAIALAVMSRINLPSVWLTLAACAALGTGIYLFILFAVYEKPGTVLHRLRKLRGGHDA